MADTTNYICPNCLGPLHFSSETGKLLCDFCGSSFSPQDFETVNQQAVDSTATPQEEEKEILDSWGKDAETMRAYRCSSCGAQLITEHTTAATSCPYCGSPTIVPGQFHGMLKPDLVIPFRLSKEDAEKALKRHYQKKLLLPSVFAEENHIREIKGIYVPFWLFDLEASGSITFHGSRSTTHRSGNYRITDTRHYALERTGSISFEKVPVDGSKKMPDDLMDSIEPYDYKDLTPFTTAYLPGFLADKYDVAAKDSYERAMNRSMNSTLDAFRDTVSGYSDVRATHKDVDITQKNMKYALLPVWLLTTKWKDHTYLFAMNGQTGKMVGDLPVDKKKKALLYWGSFAASAVLLFLTVGPRIGQILWTALLEIFN